MLNDLQTIFLGSVACLSLSGNFCQNEVFNYSQICPFPPFNWLCFLYLVRKSFAAVIIKLSGVFSSIFCNLALSVIHEEQFFAVGCEVEP